MKKIRKGDMVVLITGRDKGRKGAVIEVLADDRVRVEGLNMSKKHQRPNPQMGVQGGIIEREAPLRPLSRPVIRTTKSPLRIFFITALLGRER